MRGRDYSILGHAASPETKQEPISHGLRREIQELSTETLVDARERVTPPATGQDDQ